MTSRIMFILSVQILLTACTTNPDRHIDTKPESNDAKIINSLPMFA